MKKLNFSYTGFMVEFCHSSLRLIELIIDNQDHYESIDIKNQSKEFETVYQSQVDEFNAFCHQIAEDFLSPLDREDLFKLTSTLMDFSREALSFRDVIYMEEFTEEELKAIPLRSIQEVLEDSIDLLENMLVSNRLKGFLPMLLFKQEQIQMQRRNSKHSWSKEVFCSFFYSVDELFESLQNYLSHLIYITIKYS